MRFEKCDLFEYAIDDYNFGSFMVNDWADEFARLIDEFQVTNGFPTRFSDEHEVEYHVVLGADFVCGQIIIDVIVYVYVDDTPQDDVPEIELTENERKMFAKKLLNAYVEEVLR